MNTKEVQLIVFEIKNSQEDYAMCLEFIKTYEANNKSIYEKLNDLLEIVENAKIELRGFDNKASCRWIEEPIQLRGQSFEEARNIFEENLRNSTILDKECLYFLLTHRLKLHYHIRVHMEFEEQKIKPGNLVHLQYLALLLKRLSCMGFFKEKIKRELSVFLVPSSADKYPFGDKNGFFDDKIYNVASQYLRIIAKKYSGVIFCVENKKRIVRVHAIETHDVRGCDDYFPVIAIDTHMYEKLFNSNENITYFENLKGKRKNTVKGPFGESSNKNPEIAMPDFITKTAYKRIIKTLGNNVEEVFRLLESCDKKSIIKFCLFSFLVNSEEELENTWNLAEEVEKGIRQVVQNAVQHSETHECLFSFYLHEKEETETAQNFIKRITKQYPAVTFESEHNKLAALEIFVSDINEKQDMLDSFRTNLQEDMFTYPLKLREHLEGHRALIDNIDKVSIRNLFSEFVDNDMKEIWTMFRKQDIVAHVGLSLLSVTAEKCRAAIKVLSCKYPIISCNRNWFYKAYGNPKELEMHKLDGKIIPGTQFSILLPIRSWSQVQTTSLGQLVMQNKLSEDYKCFAQYLDYDEKRIPVIRRLQVNEQDNLTGEEQRRSSIGNRRDKNKAVILWYKYWNSKLGNYNELLNQENVVYNFDFASVKYDVYFMDVDYIEVCLKGLLMFLSEIDTNKCSFYLALTNLPKGFIKSFCNIATLLGIKDFPENVQLYLNEFACEKKDSFKELIFIGKNYAQAMHNAYLLAIEHGTDGCSYFDYKRTLDLYKKMVLLSKTEAGEKKFEVNVCPFDTLLKMSEESNETFFEKKLQLMVENELDGAANGYKLNHTHMRLGNKVHIESFYEMSFLFYRTSVANRIAFLILKDILSTAELTIDLRRDSIIFYGYASYSKAILTSITEILRYCRENEYRDKVGFASYQHNLHSDSNEIQMYFGLESGSLGKVNKKNELTLEENVKIVQIVPISSTLTTFGKMWSEFCSHLQHKKDKERVIIYKNYTVFWVVDQASVQPAVKPSPIESKYWISVSERNIETSFEVLKLGGCNKVRYFMFSPVIWHAPLSCPLCFPENVIDEIPLVETDPTSTIPAQQIRYKAERKVNSVNLTEFTESLNRLLKLEDCIIRGHITRRQNHYQYYVDTQRYFYNVKKDVMNWLEKLREKEKPFRDMSPTLHIIFSPEHNTNVGFAQYVNTYYFGGLAEIVSINVDKQYRSNFVCEHAALMKMIEYLHKTECNGNYYPVCFYFVDDTIISGETIEKANSFLQSLIPSDYQSLYSANLFKKIFLLIDRLSNDTKRMYVENMEKNFHSFVHIDVSNVRTQGDSCVGCKIEKNARKLFKRSTTRVQAEYWAKELYNHRKIAFDNLNEIEKIDRKQSFNFMMIYHVLQNVIVNNGYGYFIGDAYEVLLNLMEWFLSNGQKGDIYGYNVLFNGIDGIEGVKNILKIICRPFFTFDYKIKLQVLSLYILFAECLLGVEESLILNKNDEQTGQKDFLFEADRIERTVDLIKEIKICLQNSFNELEFMSDYLFEGLTEMGSTYLMRKQSLKKVYSYVSHMIEKISLEDVDNFWRKYALNIHRLLFNTKDETKELWLEYLYSMGDEYQVIEKDIYTIEKPVLQDVPELYTRIIDEQNNKAVNESFKRFILELFFQNTGINFDGIEKKKQINASDEYFMEFWNKMRELSQRVLNYNGDLSKSNAEEKMFTHLENNQNSEEKSKGKVKEWYGTFLRLILGIGKEKYGINPADVSILLMTEDTNDIDNKTADVTQRLNIINEMICNVSDAVPVIRYKAKSRLGEILKDIRGQRSLLERDGYILHDSGEDDSYFILFFDNPEIEQGEFLGRSLRKIARVFLYMSIKNNNDNKFSCGIRYIMRDIVMYRNRLLRILEQDFYGDTFNNYARIGEERNVLIHEKSASHSASTDDEISVELFVRKDTNNIYHNLDNAQKAYWLLIRNSTNNQIAKLFSRSFENKIEGEIPPLYLTAEMTNEINLFSHQLTCFDDLGITEGGKKTDNRFVWIRKIVDMDIELEGDVEFISNNKGEMYNLEYFKCIFIDILLSAIKFQSDYRDDFLMRIEQFMSEADMKKCSVKVYRKASKDAEVDDLVIENPVVKWAHGLRDWEERNELINMRVNDPLVFGDGHMSLVAIKRYIEKLGATNRTCSFAYVMSKNNLEESQLMFRTCLPILRKEK